MPLDFITEDGFGITDKCKEYLLPLIEGEDYPPLWKRYCPSMWFWIIRVLRKSSRIWNLSNQKADTHVSAFFFCKNLYWRKFALIYKRSLLIKESVFTVYWALLMLINVTQEGFELDS